jgi:hypothetical protein
MTARRAMETQVTTRSTDNVFASPERAEALIAEARRMRDEAILSAFRRLLSALGDLAPARSPGVEIMRH